MAHNLRLAQPSADICLLVRNATVFRKRKLTETGVEVNEGPTLKVVRTGGDTTETSGYELDVTKRSMLPSLKQAIEDGALRAVNVGGQIDSLIVCCKAPSTSVAIEGVYDRIKPTSVITLLQNGIGVYDELCAKFWPEPTSRPQFILGTTTHGVTPVSDGSVIQTTRPGQGALKWGVVPDPRGFDVEQWLWGQQVGNLPPLTPPESPRIPLPPPPPGRGLENLHVTLEALLSMSSLNSTLLPMPHLYHELLLKLAVNAAINPLTAVLGGGFLTNGSLIRSGPGNRLLKQTVEETSQLLTAYLKTLSSNPEPDTLRLFSSASLRDRVRSVAKQTSGNYSSMALDVKHGRVTEIDYINGFLGSLGTRLGVPAPINRMLVQMVKFKAEVGGLGDTVYPQVREIVRSNEAESYAMRKLSLDERRVSLMEREMLIRETRTAEAKRAQRGLKREVKKRERHERRLSEQSTSSGESTEGTASESGGGGRSASDTAPSETP